MAQKDMHQTPIYMTSRLRSRLKIAAAIQGTTMTALVTEAAEKELRRLERQEKYSALRNVAEDGSTVSARHAEEGK